MEKKEVKGLIEGLKSYQEELGRISNGKPKRKDMDKFKTYYEKTYKKLIEYITFSKNKELSEKAKELPVLKKLFSTFNIYMSILILIMIGPLALIVYLYTLTTYNELIYAIIGVDVVVIFFLVGRIQKESVYVINILATATPTVKSVARMIEEKSK